LGFKEPSPERVEAFRRILDEHRITAPVRKNRGRDISAACGQLAVAGQGRDRVIRRPVLPVFAEQAQGETTDIGGLSVV
jgi:23S rRNA (adenine2503-C2)-methyltransferase